MDNLIIKRTLEIGLLEDAEDILSLRTAKQEEKDKPSISIADVKKELGIS